MKKADNSTKMEIKSNNSIGDTYSNFLFKENIIKITEFNKRLDINYKSVGFENIKNDFEEFWIDNNSKFLLEDGYRLINNYLYYLVKQKIYSADELTNYIEVHLGNYSEYNKIEFGIKRAGLYEKYSINKALSFLEELIINEEKSLSNPKELINLLCHYSDLLFKQKKYDLAFKNLTRTSVYLPLLNQTDYINYSYRISSFNSSVCLKESPPKYWDYLYYEFCEYLFLILSNISQFPNDYVFTRMKNTKKDNWENCTEFDTALAFLKIYNYKTDIINEINDFGFNKLPEIYGIPKEYDTTEKVNLIRKNFDTNYDDFIKVMNKIKELEEKSVIKESLEIEHFVQKVIKKYNERV